MGWRTGWPVTGRLRSNVIEANGNEIGCGTAGNLRTLGGKS